jgi:excisionase family DNA binding protein
MDGRGCSRARASEGFHVTRLLTTRQVAEILAVSPETVLRRIRSGELPAIRLASNALRVREDEFEAYLERHTTRPGLASKRD